MLSVERGAVLWLPSLWLAAAFVLTGMVLASSERPRFTQASDLRVALGLLQAQGVSGHDLQVFEAGLRRGLSQQRELALVDGDTLKSELRAVLGTPAPADARVWMRATRQLQVRYLLTGELAPRAGRIAGRLQLWEVASERTMCTLAAEAVSPEQLGNVLADSVAVALFRPRVTSQAAGRS